MWPWRKRTQLSPNAPGTRRVVTDHVFLLGLDELYRAAMKERESGELLECARRVVSTLGEAPDRGAPAEGYYAESPALTEYLQLMRTLQRVGTERRPEVNALAEFHRLVAVSSSPHLACGFVQKGLLPVARDALSIALLKTEPDWSIPAILEAASAAAKAADDISLVGMAALCHDAVALAAVRESVVLYAEVMFTGRPSITNDEVVWEVSPELAARAARFVEAVNVLLHTSLPAPTTAAAEAYWYGHRRNKILGRCVRLGHDSRRSLASNYHWAIARREDHFVVDDFWHERVWTTAMYRAAPPSLSSDKA